MKKKGFRSFGRAALSLAAVLVSLNLLASGTLVATVQSRNDIYVPLAGSNPPGDDTAEVFSSTGEPWYKENAGESVEITSFDGLKLRGTAWIREGCSEWAVCVHGYSSSARSMLNIGGMLWDAGYNVLLPDLRAHGESEGSVVGMGWTDRKDVTAWCEWITQTDPCAATALLGVSMGAAAVLMASGDGLPEKVYAVVSDCSYTSVEALMEYHIKQDLGLPSFPVSDISGLLSKAAAGYSWTEASALEQVKKNVVPTLFIHGGDDEFVPVDMVYELYGAAVCPKALMIVGGAGHAQSQYADRELYMETVLEFLRKFRG